MSQVVETKRICDRCKRELPLYPSFKIMRGKPNKIQALATRHSWGDGYPVDSIKELCPNCKKEFDAFMAGARWNVIELYEFLARLRRGCMYGCFFAVKKSWADAWMKSRT